MVAAVMSETEKISSTRIIWLVSFTIGYTLAFVREYLKFSLGVGYYNLLEFLVPLLSTVLGWALVSAAILFSGRWLLRKITGD
jgi:hypothetical protein